MINIVYDPSDAHTAETIQADLSQASLRLDNPILLILVTPDAMADSSILDSIRKAKQDKHVLVPVLLRSMAIPDVLKEERILDQTKGYKKSKLIQFIKQADIGKEQTASNRRLFFYIAGAAVLMFAISLASIASGVVQFPVDEYATENAIRDAQVNTIVAPQLDAIRPRSTEDALNFDATIEAIENDDLLPFLVGTATAIPQQLQATNDARSTQIIQTEAAQTEASDE